MLFYCFHLLRQGLCIRTGSSLLQSLDLGLHILQIHYILHGLYQIVHRTSDTVLEALICSGIHLNGLVEAYIIFDDLFCRITLEVFLIIFRYFLIRIRTGTCK